MPSFDLVSKLDSGEVKNAVTMAQKEVASRYDFKGSNTSIEMDDKSITITADDDYKIGAALDILRTKMAKRNLGMKSMEVGEPIATGLKMLKLTISLKAGIDKEQGKVINKIVKESKLKVTSAYMDEKIRLTGKSIDELQQAWATIRNHNDVKIELQMENMKR